MPADELELDKDMDAMTAWLNAVLDAQTEYSTIPVEDRCEEPGLDGPDEYWGFFSEWRHMIIDVTYNLSFPEE